ncbi:MAG TPA: TlpA disulfide reductase family protein [Bryobacteraceae bacterium]|nr:TlpA disulfide reductase family protein [Bryobacteraceae bacterium]
MHAVLFFAFFQAAPPTEFPLRAECSNDAAVITSVGRAEPINIVSSLAGDGPTCYHVRLDRGSKSVVGYIIGAEHPSILAFERERAILQARESVPVPAAQTAPPIEEPVHPAYFDNFSGVDAAGNPISLARMKGKVFLVTFWSPAVKRSRQDLASLGDLVGEYGARGLTAIGIAMDSNASRISGVLDDTPVTWPQFPDRIGLAAKYGVDRNSATTFVLDESHRIIAVSPRRDELAKIVRTHLEAK